MASTNTAALLYKNVGVHGLSKRTNKKRTSALIKRILPYLKKKDKILDLGCGYGRISIPLQRMSYNVHGLDISANLLEHAKANSKQPAKFKHGTIENLPYQANSFNKVMCLWSVWNEILGNHNQCLNEIYRVLKTKGIAIIDMIDSDTLFMKIVLFISRAIYKTKNPRIWTARIRHNGRYYIVQYFLHNQKYLFHLLKKSKFNSFHFKKHKIYGRNRLFLVLNK